MSSRLPLPGWSPEPLLARPPRLDAPGVTHHVWARAVEGRPIFLEPHDGEGLVRRLAELCVDVKARCFAWTLMSNHLHLVVRTDEGRLSSLVDRLHTGFATQFNRSRGRQGHVFQSRFGSRTVRSDGDLLGLIRYVHRNPLEAGLVRDVEALADYGWCGHAALLGRRAPHPFEAVDETLALFGGNRRASVDGYRDWIARPTEEDLSASDALAALIRETCAELDVREADLRGGRRVARLSEARALICQKAVRELGVRNRELARRLRITESAVSQALRRVT